MKIARMITMNVRNAADAIRRPTVSTAPESFPIVLDKELDAFWS